MRISRIKTTSLAVLLVTTACTGDKTIDSGVVCVDPVASVAEVATVTLGATVTLDGSASDVCSKYTESAVYTWAIEQVPTGSAVDESSLSDNKSNSASQTSFIPDTTGDYVWTLQVSDSMADSPVEYVVVNVVSGDQPPVADCGENLNGTVSESIAKWTEPLPMTPKVPLWSTTGHSATLQIALPSPMMTSTTQQDPRHRSFRLRRHLHRGLGGIRQRPIFRT